jgi:hypothetical protein
MIDTIDIPFTQYHLPNGRQTKEIFAAPKELKPKVDEILSHGLEFTAEVLTNGYCSFCISNNQMGLDVDCEICPNGPTVPEHIIALVKRFDSMYYEKLLIEKLC